eukprot:211082-Rhodomonas_salina.1
MAPTGISTPLNGHRIPSARIGVDVRALVRCQFIETRIPRGGEKSNRPHVDDGVCIDQGSDYRERATFVIFRKQYHYLFMSLWSSRRCRQL